MSDDRMIEQDPRTMLDSEDWHMTHVIICGDTGVLEPRDSCPHRLHDYPMPAGYVEAIGEADRRISQRWRNRRCPDCGKYGWEKP